MACLREVSSLEHGHMAIHFMETLKRFLESSSAVTIHSKVRLIATKVFLRHDLSMIDQSREQD